MVGTLAARIQPMVAGHQAMPTDFDIEKTFKKAAFCV
jgi:hypothetical protein